MAPAIDAAMAEPDDRLRLAAHHDRHAIAHSQRLHRHRATLGANARALGEAGEIDLIGRSLVQDGPGETRRVKNVEHAIRAGEHDGFARRHRTAHGERAVRPDIDGPDTRDASGDQRAGIDIDDPVIHQRAGVSQAGGEQLQRARIGQRLATENVARATQRPRRADIDRRLVQS